MNAKTIIFIMCSLTGCAYRYGTGYFMNDVPVHRPPPPQEEAPEPTAQPVASADPIPCSEETIEKLEVTNKLDSKNNTITTTAVTSHTHDRSTPCFR